MNNTVKSILLLLGFCWLIPAAAIPPTTITAIQASRQASLLRIEIKSTRPMYFRHFELKHPKRLIIDVQQGRLAQPITLPTLAFPLIQRLRTSVQPNGDLRFVFDLQSIATPKVYTLKKPYHFMIDFKWPKKQVHRQPKQRDVLVVIDPGHGGKDPGATGPRGTHEKNVVLAIAKKLQNIINHQSGFRAVLTRNKDRYISLRRRLTIARHYQGDIFIAIHADAFRNRTARGASIYALSRRGATSEAARWIARQENQSELMGGVELSNKDGVLKSVLINLSQTATIRASLLIGKQLIQFLDHIAYLHHSRVEQAAFVVLKSPDIPSLLVETGFLSNPSEERRLRSPAYQQRLALAMAKGIRHYFIQRPPRNSWLAYWRDHPRHHSQPYIVHRGDTLIALSQRFQVSLDQIKTINRLKSLYLQVGQVLLIPKR